MDITMTPEELCELVYEAAGAATGPLLRDNPEYVFPAEEVGQAVARVVWEKTAIDVTKVPGYAGLAA